MHVDGVEFNFRADEATSPAADSRRVVFCESVESGMAKIRSKTVGGRERHFEWKARIPNGGKWQSHYISTRE